MFSVSQVGSLLTSRYGNTIDGVELLGAGEWSTAFAFRRNEQDLVVRFGRHRDDFEKDRAAARFATAALPIPSVLEIGPTSEGWFAVSERASGQLLDHLDAASMRAVVPSVLAVLDATRTADVSGTAVSGTAVSGTDGYGAWDGAGTAPHPTWPAFLLALADIQDNPESRIHGWRARLESSPAALAAFRDGTLALHRLVELCPADRHLIHSDLLNRNVMVAQGRISAVFDWANSMYGDFLYDLAWFVFWAPEFPAMNGIDWAAEALRHFTDIGVPVPNFADRLRCYQIHIGLDSLIYNAFKGRSDALEKVAARTSQLTLCG